MSKRKHISENAAVSPPKRVKLSYLPRPSRDGIDRLSRLSDELLLRIFSYLDITELNIVQRISRKYEPVAADSQLWRDAYYDRFVKPRTLKVPTTRGINSFRFRQDRSHTAKSQKWLGEENLMRPGNTTNWKRQYRLRHNWAKGQCNQVVINIAEERPLPPLHVRFHEGIVYTADLESGLRAWDSKKERCIVGLIKFDGIEPPTSLAVDLNSAKDEHHITVGFRDGKFIIYSFSIKEQRLKERYTHPPSTNGMLMAVAHCSPFLVTMTAAQLLSVYRISEAKDGVIPSPLLLHSLRSHTMWPPLAISLRPVADSCIVAITYVIPTILNWAVGIQELQLNAAGDIQESRVASSAYSGGTLGSRTAARSPGVVPFNAAAPAFSKPTSISYTHPYLLLSHPDNTLTLFLVTSTAEGLSISEGTRLWGHTSAVSGAHVEGRGKAVSVSAKGEELRIWELEGSLSRRWVVDGKWSVQVKPGSTSTLPSRTSEFEDGVRMRGWVGFDDESVVVLKERSVGRQDLVVYDFT